MLLLLAVVKALSSEEEALSEILAAVAEVDEFEEPEKEVRPTLNVERHHEKMKTTRIRSRPSLTTASPKLELAESQTLEQLQKMFAEGQREERVDTRELQRRARLFGTLDSREKRRHQREATRILKRSKYGHYKLLRVRNKADAGEIKQRYRHMALLVHPDRNPAPDAVAAFDALHRAAETLADPKLRRDYDRRQRRKALVKRDRFWRHLAAFVETSVAYLHFRSKQHPFMMLLGGVLPLLLVLV